MNELIGVRWGYLEEETQLDLLERANCIDGSTGDTCYDGECIVDLNEELSVKGVVKDGEIIILRNSIIYAPQWGVPEVKKDINFIINEVLVMSEAAEFWGITEGTIRAAIKRKKFIIGIDYKKSGRITLITKKAMERVFGELDG